MTARRRPLGTPPPVALGDLGTIAAPGDAVTVAPVAPKALAFRVAGPPVPWQRVANGHVPPRTRAYKKLVGFIALAARTQHDGGLDRLQGWPMGAPEYAVEIEIYRVPPRGKARKGDVDNYAKSILDACTGVLYADDGAVTDLRVLLLPCAAGRECAIVSIEARAAVARARTGATS